MGGGAQFHLIFVTFTTYIGDIHFVECQRHPSLARNDDREVSVLLPLALVGGGMRHGHNVAVRVELLPDGAGGDPACEGRLGPGEAALGGLIRGRAELHGFISRCAAVDICVLARHAMTDRGACLRGSSGASWAYSARRARRETVGLAGRSVSGAWEYGEREKAHRDLGR